MYYLHFCYFNTLKLSFLKLIRQNFLQAPRLAHKFARCSPFSQTFDPPPFSQTFDPPVQKAGSAPASSPAPNPEIIPTPGRGMKKF